jgi:hypothetical protein
MTTRKLLEVIHILPGSSQTIHFYYMGKSSNNEGMIRHHGTMLIP